MKAIYIGQRITTKNRLGYFWLDDGNERGYAKQLAPAQIGEEWMFTMKGTSFIVSGKDGPKQTGSFASKEQINDWVGQDAVAKQKDLERRVKAKLASRETQIDRYLEPLRLIVKGLPVNDQYVFIHYLTIKLLR